MNYKHIILPPALGDELLFKQMKQNFPLRYFYGESANVIKVQIWVPPIANLQLKVMWKGLRRQWSFSGEGNNGQEHPDVLRRLPQPDAQLPKNGKYCNRRHPRYHLGHRCLIHGAWKSEKRTRPP